MNYEFSSTEFINNNIDFVTRIYTNKPFYKNLDKLDFIKGECIVKSGRKTIAKIYDRKEYYKCNNIKSAYSEKYPYSLTINNMMKECTSLNECLEMILKYC